MKTLMAPDDDDLGLEDAWADLRKGTPKEPEEPKQLTVWMGFGIKGEELCYAGYQRVETNLYLDGTDMDGTIKSPERQLQIDLVGLWFKPLGGKPFYTKECTPVVIYPGDSATFHIALTDEGGFLIRTFEALDLL